MLNKNIRELRIENGLTQAQLAEKIGVTQGAIYFWEKGINEPTAGYVVKLARFFGVSADELLSYSCDDKSKGSLKLAEMTGCFLKLSPSQQDIIITVTKEFLKTI